MTHLKRKRYTLYKQTKYYSLILKQVYDTYLNIVDNVLEGRKDQLLMSQTKSNSSSRYVAIVSYLYS